MRPGRGTLALLTSETRYARTSDATHVAYQVSGDGPIDLLVMRAWHSNLEHEWEEPILAGVYRRLGSLARVIRLDRRGSGLSDRFDPNTQPSLEHRIDDIRAVLDAARSERVIPWAPLPTMIGAVDPAAFDAVRDTLALGWGTRESAAQTVSVADPSRVGTSGRESAPLPSQARYSSAAPCATWRPAPGSRSRMRGAISSRASRDPGTYSGSSTPDIGNPD